ncbi:MAG: hypothetical protein ACQEW2_09395 [Bacillota bacterium]|nr:hypothetical protein [Cytobacillus firmus]MDD9312426.1 hypothetical protein [Cytobacillus firmus]MEC1893385.1 hypothetical protein [Cytobacillus firmus]MED4450821.1 hypothetical protein [Cytobacillus firmus]MED4767071.1 hypothetical protein [Cytobacillus firmus]SUV04500.1 Uncharacterised protein [Cytobacillus firmus]
MKRQDIQEMYKKSKSVAVGSGRKKKAAARPVQPQYKRCCGR